VGDTYLPWLKAAPLVVNIDHHNANTEFGHFNIVVETASSTSEIIFDLLCMLEKDLGREDIIHADSAMALLAGIIGDTGSFRYATTSAKTFLAAHTLVLRGARPDTIAQKLFASVSLAAVRLQADAMSSMQMHFNGKFAEVLVSQEMLARHGAELLDSDSLVERARDIEGVLVAALFKQDLDLWRVSLRSRSGTVDVAAIARSFGGGGHKPAAAFRWRRDLPTLQSELRARIQEALEALPSE
jgi:phosphoesterase RecJ-like protein